MACAGGDFSECGVKSDKCKERAGRYLGQEYKTCPIKSLLDDDCLVYAMQLESEMSAAPVADWPDGYSDWVVKSVLDLKRGRADRKAHEISNAQKQAKKQTRGR